MRRAGFRLVQVWVPDTRSPQFAKECRRQMRLIARAKEEEEAVMKWIDDTRDVEGWSG